MDQKQRLELAQVLKLSPSLLQSMGILQMTTLELADYLNDLALENPVMEEAPPGEETLSGEAFASRVPWRAGESGPAALCAQLAAAGLGALPVTVGENLGLASRRIFAGTAAGAAGERFGPLAVLLAEPAFRLPARTPGWPDETFVRAEGVPMTKRAVRAQVLAQLALCPGETVWDVGAGTGSVSLEMAYANGGAPVWAVERLPEACAVLEENRRRLGGWNVRPVSGEAPAALAGLPAPDAVFIGGTRGRLGPILDAALAANPAARICLTAIALETLAAALDACAARGLEAEITQIAAAHAAGRPHLLRAANPVFLITATAAKERA